MQVQVIDNNLIVTLPDGIPAPKFEMFQQVRYGSRVGTIVAMRWVCALEAILEDEEAYGWAYSISYVYGKRPEDMVNKSDSMETTFCVFERSLVAVTPSVEGDRHAND